MIRAGAPILLLAALLGAAAAAAPMPPMIDAHAHYSATDAAALSPEQVIARVDAAGVERLVVTGAPPQLAQQLYRHAPGRVIPLLGVYGSEADKGSWMRDPELPARAEAWLAQGRWAGIGELHLFAADARNPVFERLVRLADAHRLVLMIHGDEEVVERAFELAPQLRVLWAHLGTVPQPQRLARMLERHPNTLWIDTSVREERIAPDGRLLPEWRALFESHPGRFVAAVDTFSLNRWQHYGAVVEAIRAWAAPLDDALEARLLHDNAAQLFAPFLQGEDAARR